MQRWDDFRAEQLDGPHDVLVGHWPFIAIDMQVAGVQMFDDLRELLDHGIRIADDDVVRRPASSS